LLPAVDAAARNRAVPTRSPSGPSRSERKQDANVGKLLQPSSNTQPEPQAQPFTIGDAPSSRTQALAQPAPTTSSHHRTPRRQGEARRAASAVLAEAAGAATKTANNKDVKPQIAFEPAASSAAQTPQAAPAVIQSARVLERMGQSEIRVGLNSDGFGSIELHARVSQDQVGASIATSHTELRAAMMAEMPSLKQAIAQHQLRLDGFNLDARTGAQTGDTGHNGGNPSGPRSWIQSGPEVSECDDDLAAQETSLPASVDSTTFFQTECPRLERKI
jgi:flagellar hook-length control protein FliK